MPKVEELTDSNFEQKTSSGIVLVDFWAEWCGPCKMFSPILEEIAEEVKGKALIVKVDVDKCSAIASKLQIRSIPTIILKKDGKEENRFIGVQEKTEIIKAIDKAINADK